MNRIRFEKLVDLAMQRCIGRLGLGYDAQLLKTHARLWRLSQHITSRSTVPLGALSAGAVSAKTFHELRIPFPALVALSHEIELQLRSEMEECAVEIK